LDKLLELLEWVDKVVEEVVMGVAKVPMEGVDKVVCPTFLDKLLELLDWVDKVVEQVDKIPMEVVDKDFCGLCKTNINFSRSEETEPKYFTAAEITESLNKTSLDQLSERIDLSHVKDNFILKFASKILEKIRKLL